MPDKIGTDLNYVLESDAKQIPGMTYITRYLNPEQQRQLLEIVDEQVWSRELQRRVQQYGYSYEHQDGSIFASEYLGVLPDWANNMARKLAKDFSTKIVADQLLVNEYQPGQGTKSHIDCIPCFGNTIFLLSLGSSCVMDFTNSQATESASILLLPGSLAILQQAARYRWLHGIAARKIDMYQGKEYTRTRRVSLTFREVLFPHK
ncbi:alpha-ketoglutarate-dependent dioxygenase AlkB [Lyngbya aestuarii]|uniref:alpha-ketoglutarate-dependent dioxygenase AlkB n=1 Tax=Lyngbya aestuarii TaxID=118322 RepID=UPI00403E3500